MQVRMVVFTQSTRVEIDHFLELAQAFLNVAHFINLLLIRGDHKTRAAVIENICHLFCRGVGVQRHRHSTDRLHSDHRPIQVWTIAADDCDEIAFIYPKRQQT